MFEKIFWLVTGVITWSPFLYLIFYLDGMASKEEWETNPDWAKKKEENLPRQTTIKTTVYWTISVAVILTINHFHPF